MNQKAEGSKTIFSDHYDEIVKDCGIKCLNDGTTALFHACNENVVEALVRSGANVNVKDNSGKTALFQASNENVVKALVAAAVDVNAKDLNNGTALCEALCEKTVDTRVVKALVEAGADVNFRDNDGKTALSAIMKYHLESNGALESVITLLSGGLKISVFDYTTRDFLHYASGSRDIKRKVLDLLFAAGEEDPKYGNIPEYLPPENEINLKHLCRKVIRSHLLKLDPHTHLFGRVPRLGLPSLLTEYLLYNQTLDDDGHDSSTDEKMTTTRMMNPDDDDDDDDDDFNNDEDHDDDDAYL